MTAMIALSGATKVFGEEAAVTALNEVDLVIDAGQYLAVVGPSGSGKSTLLNIIGLLDTLTSGSYTLAGRRTDSLTDNERTMERGRRIGFVFQQFHMLEQRTATQNVELGLLYLERSAARRRAMARAALARVGLAHRLDAVASTLSGGERQRVAIARAVVKQPAILLCDEPTGNLDTRTRMEILDLFADLHAGGQTLVVITHDPVTAAGAELTCTMTDGRVTQP